MQNEIAYELSHHCPNCGAEQRYVYDGFEESHCMHNGFRQIWALQAPQMEVEAVNVLLTSK